MEQKDIKLSGIEAVCTKAVRKDNGSTLILTIELPGLQDYIGRIEYASFTGKMAHWEGAAKCILLWELCCIVMLKELVHYMRQEARVLTCPFDDGTRKLYV